MTDTIHPLTSRLAALRVRCPHCNMPAGVDCYHQPNGKRNERKRRTRVVHAERKRRGEEILAMLKMEPAHV